jgi:hypothetical protein
MEHNDEFKIDNEYDTFDICRMCQRRLMGAAVELKEMWLDN